MRKYQNDPRSLKQLVRDYGQACAIAYAYQGILICQPDDARKWEDEVRDLLAEIESRIDSLTKSPTHHSDTIPTRGSAMYCGTVDSRHECSQADGCRRHLQAFGPHNFTAGVHVHRFDFGAAPVADDECTSCAQHREWL